MSSCAGAGTGTVTGVTDAEVDGDPVQRVRVQWAGGASAEFTVVNSDGPHVCGVTPAG